MIKQNTGGNRPAQESPTTGSTAAMGRAEAAAIRRASRTRLGAPTCDLDLADPENVNEQHSSFHADVGEALGESERILIWVADQLDGLRLPDLPNEKRLQLAAGCLHVAIEHAQAIVVLIQEKCFGSALALQRPLIEVYVRGLWLYHAATAGEVDHAGRDSFPTRDKIDKALNAKFDDGAFTHPERALWATLCSYTHTGYMQIGARLTVDGVRSNYALDEVRQSLRFADMLQLASAIVVVNAADNPELAQAMLDRLKEYAGEDPRP